MNDLISRNELYKNLEDEIYFTESAKAAFRAVVRKCSIVDPATEKCTLSYKIKPQLPDSNFEKACKNCHSMMFASDSYCPNCGRKVEDE